MTCTNYDKIWTYPTFSDTNKELFLSKSLNYDGLRKCPYWHTAALNRKVLQFFCALQKFTVSFRSLPIAPKMHWIDQMLANMAHFHDSANSFPFFILTQFSGPGSGHLKINLSCNKKVVYRNVVAHRLKN